MTAPSTTDAPSVSAESKPTAEELRTDVIAGNTYDDMARKYTVSRQTIGYWMNKAGFGVRRVPLRFGEHIILHRRDGTEEKIDGVEE